MNNSCRVSQDEINHDLRSIKRNESWPETKSILRMEVMNTATAIIEGQTTHVQRYGRPYTFNDVLDDVFNHKLFTQAMLACYWGDRAPLSDLISRCVHRAVAVSWYGEEDADDLGFVK